MSRRSAWPRTSRADRRPQHRSACRHLSRPSDAIAVLGAGSWGTALAVHLARPGHDVRLWARDAGSSAQMREHRANPRYLRRRAAAATGSSRPTMRRRRWPAPSSVVVAVPSHVVRGVVRSLRASMPGGRRSWSARPRASKRDSLQRMSQVIAEEAPDGRRSSCCRARASPWKSRAGCRRRSLAASADAAAARAHPGVLPRPVVPALWQRRCGRRGDRRRLEERHRDRRRRGRRTRAGAQLDGRPDHPRAGRDLAPGRRRRRAAARRCPA